MIVGKLVIRDLSMQRCPFCIEIPGTIQFLRHNCHYLKEIFLIAILYDVETDDDDKSEQSRGKTGWKRRDCMPHRLEIL